MLRSVLIRFGSQVIAHQDMKHVFQQVCASSVEQRSG
jgi:hypothetical protein